MSYHITKPAYLRPSGFHPFFSLQNKWMKDFWDLNSWFDDSSQEFKEGSMIPLVDIIEDENTYKIEVELSGIDEKDLNVSIENKTLKLKAEKQVSKKNDKKNYISREISYGSYERNIPLPDYVDIKKAKASFKRGMLWVDFPKKSECVEEYRQLKIETV